jgi:hypothetical protein
VKCGLDFKNKQIDYESKRFLVATLWTNNADGIKSSMNSSLIETSEKSLELKKLVSSASSL